MARILQIQIQQFREDKLQWDFAPTGIYDSKSGYRLTDILLDIDTEYVPLPPLEKRLWSDLWKVKTSPKIRHFLWKVLSGALGVKVRLQTRNIPVSSQCPVCLNAEETICHMLFHCDVAKETWERSQFPILSGGFSTNSIFLNLFHILKEMKKRQNVAKIVQRAPWILWQIWKASNLLVFENTRYEAHAILDKASKDAEMWFVVNYPPVESSTSLINSSPGQQKWSKPDMNQVKCNIGSSWISHDQNAGAAWIIRNSQGISLTHGRRSSSRVISQLDAGLLSLWWALQSVSKLRHRSIVFKTEFPLVIEAFYHPSRFPQIKGILTCIQSFARVFDNITMKVTHPSANSVASSIAGSVISLYKFDSYISNGGPQ